MQELNLIRRQLLRFALVTLLPVLIFTSATTWWLESIQTRLRTALALIELEDRR